MALIRAVWNVTQTKPFFSLVCGLGHLFCKLTKISHLSSWLYVPPEADLDSHEIKILIITSIAPKFLKARFRYNYRNN